MNNKQIKEYFVLHPEVQEFHFTNEFAFENLDLAREHARVTKQDEPKSFTREQAEALPDDSAEAPEGGGSVVDYTKWTNDQLKAELNSKEVAFDPKATKAVLIELLTAASK